MMLQTEKPDDYVIATGETYSVREFLQEVFGHLDLDWQNYVSVDPSKAKRELGWSPKVTFKKLAQMMTEEDLKIARREKLIQDHRATE